MPENGKSSENAGIGQSQQRSGDDPQTSSRNVRPSVFCMFFHDSMVVRLDASCMQLEMAFARRIIDIMISRNEHMSAKKPSVGLHCSSGCDTRNREVDNASVYRQA